MEMNAFAAVIPECGYCVPAALFFVLFFFGCDDPAGNVPTMAELRSEQLPDQESWMTRFDVLDGDRPRVRIYAGYIGQFEREDSTYMLLRGHPDSLAGRVEAHLFDEKGDSSAVITADEMRYFQNERRFEARGNVVVTTTDAKRLETEHLIWMEIDRKVSTTGFVRITTPTEFIQGYDLVADEDLETYEIARVTGQSVVEEL